MSDLWRDKRRENRASAEPLAQRMRPQSLDEFVGQEHFLGQDKLLRRMIEADRITSLIFYGPPGTGKTTLAEVIANHTQRRFERANAAGVGVKEVREVLQRAKDALENDGLKTIFFLDEIHRFNRAQQDILLGDVERGTIALIGATTENPFFAVNAPLVSRSQIFQFEPLSRAQIVEVLKRALADKQRGLGWVPVSVHEEALEHWARISDGDARRALMALEIAVASGGAGPDAPVHSGSAEHPNPDFRGDTIIVDLPTAEASIQQKAIVHDPTGDQHYDLASALIKSVRGSDPDAAVYWVARMLQAGEDPRFIARRLAILASEDIGNADPRGIQVAAAAFDITERIGMPECQLTLAQAAIFLATAPKSNASAKAIWSAMSDVKQGRTLPVPKHLRDSHYAGAERLGSGEGYQYAHDHPGGYAQQDYLGVERTYYEPTDRGYEKRIGEYLRSLNPPPQE